MIPILLIAKNAELVEEYLIDSAKKNRIQSSYIFRYRKDPNVITINQIRDISLLVSKPAARVRLIVIYDFDTAKLPAQTSFLKTLEEKSDSNCFVLISEHLAGILPTILSRVKVINLSADSPKILHKSSEAKINSQATLVKKLKQTVKIKRSDAIAICDELIYTYRQMLSDEANSYRASTILKQLLDMRSHLSNNNVIGEYALDNIFMHIERVK